ncbi:hypothetical protein MMC28_002274 [Mycoblastus sanguinarius]|nr:hypothetical protein [Mycoblastus sanguinarius]
MAVTLELGPNGTYLFDTPSKTARKNLPLGLKDIEGGIGPGKSIHHIYGLSFGWNGAYFMSCRTANGPTIRRYNLPPALEVWLIDSTTNTCRRDIPTLGVELGPNGSFYARDKNSYRWHNLPEGLEDAIQQRITPAGWSARPDFVVLGAEGAYIYSNDCGGHSYALGNYPRLAELIKTVTSMNVMPQSGFSLLHAELDPAAASALEGISPTFPRTIPQSPPAQQLTPQASPPIIGQHSPPIMQQASSPMISQTSLPIRTQASPPMMTTPPARKPVSPPAVQSSRPAPHQRQSSNLGRFLSDTSSKVLANVINTDIRNAQAGHAGGGHAGGSHAGGGQSSGGDVYIVDNGGGGYGSGGDVYVVNDGGGDSGDVTLDVTLDSSGTSFWSPIQDSTSDPIQSGYDSC